MPAGNTTNDDRASAHVHTVDSSPFGHFSYQKQLRRQQTAPARYPISRRHLDEFTSRETLVPAPVQQTGPYKPTRRPTSLSGAAPPSLKKPLSIKPMRFLNFLADGVALYVSNLLHPEQIPGRDLFSRIYAMGVLPILIVVLTVIQWSIGLLVIIVNETRLGAHYYGIFFRGQVTLIDETDFLDPEGNNEAVRLLADREPKVSTHFNYLVANLLLIMSSMSYQRDDKLVAQASKILLNVQSPAQRDEAAKLLQKSEREIDESAKREFGMRFVGISELKTLGGPFAGLFYNDDVIVLVFKGTSIFAFNEYLLDVTIQRVDASEYLYGEVHQGFYESLFPDPKPLNWYEDMTYDQTNPFNTIMQTIFETAKIAKHKTGKPVNLWLTGHSLGGALAALTMARLQMIVEDSDPLMGKDYDETHGKGSSALNNEPRTVLQEMLVRFSDDPELLVLRDCYSVGSPKIGDSTFAERFARNELQFSSTSPYKPTYWRIVADMDVVPRLPPGCSVDPNEPRGDILPSAFYPRTKSWLIDEKQEDGDERAQQQQSGGQRTAGKTQPKHLHSLLDYQHVGQLVKVYSASRMPKVQPSAFEADLSQDVLRTEKEMQILLDNMTQVAAVWKAKDHLVDAVSMDSKPTTTTTTTRATTVTAASHEASQIRTNQQLAIDSARAQALFDVEESSRLRQLHFLERTLLKIPSLLSHAPATYQRNLVRGRFYFKSFPGVAFETRIGEMVEPNADADADANTAC
ncbi:hypothetical protein BGZ98_009744 [Dissophora globulifera]|nr:hypothetical protein BGZ98_009744 [Dissophora globulifera]